MYLSTVALQSAVDLRKTDPNVSGRTTISYSPNGLVTRDSLVHLDWTSTIKLCPNGYSENGFAQACSIR